MIQKNATSTWDTSSRLYHHCTRAHTTKYNIILPGMHSISFRLQCATTVHNVLAIVLCVVLELVACKCIRPGKEGLICSLV